MEALVSASVPVRVEPDPDKKLDAAVLHRCIRQAVVSERKAIRIIALGLAEMKRTKLFQQLGYVGIVDYGREEFGFARSKTWQLARVGAQLPRFPLLDEALKTGALGWTKARIVASVATTNTEQAWVETALKTNCRKLEDMAWRASPGADPFGPEDEIEDLQYVWARVRMEALHYELLMRAMQKIRKVLGKPTLSMSQFMLELAERELARGEEAEEKAEEQAAQAEEQPSEQPAEQAEEPGSSENNNAVVRQRGENAWHSNYRVVEKRCPTCHKAWMDTHGGPIVIEHETRQMIECDADVVAGDDSAGTPGHRKSAIPPSVRRAVLARDDARCQVPGCPNNRWLDLHHIVPRSKGGKHVAENLVTVCTTHHAALHRNVVSVRRGPDGQLIWKRSHGEAFGVILRMDGDVGEIEHNFLDYFDGPAGTWPLLDKDRSRPLSSVELRVREAAVGKNNAHVCTEGTDEGGADPPKSRYPRGRWEFWIGDDERAGNIEYRPRLPGS